MRSGNCKLLCNLVPGAHVFFGQHQDTELWNNQQSRSQSPRVNIGYVAVYMSSEDMIGLLKCSLIGRTPFVYANASHWIEDPATFRVDVKFSVAIASQSPLFIQEFFNAPDALGRHPRKQISKLKAQF